MKLRKGGDQLYSNDIHCASDYIALDSGTCKNAHCPSHFPIKLSFSFGASTRSFLPRFFPDGHHSRGVKLRGSSLVCDSAHKVILRPNAQTNQKEGRTVPELACAFYFSVFLLSVRPLPDLSVLPFVIFSPLLVSCMYSFR